MPNSVTFTNYDMLEASPETFTEGSTIEDARIILDGMMLESELTEEEIAAIAGMYPSWSVGIAMGLGKVYSFNNALYRVVQAHTSQADWTPPAVPALFVKCVPASIIAEWVQPTGAQDAYNIGARVSFNGSIYESLINANVWSPTAYPQGWKKL